MSAEAARRPAVFFDTNVLVYLVADDPRKATVAEEALSSEAHSCIVSTQVLSEFVNVLRKKRRTAWNDIREHLARLHVLCRVEPLTDETVEAALDLAEQHSFAWYDAMIVASALAAGATRLLTEDMQAGRKIGRLRIENPFRA